MTDAKLLSATRIDLLKKQAEEDPEKYDRRLSYASYVKPLPISRDLFLKTGNLTMPVSVGDYTVVVEISNVIERILDAMDKEKVTRLTRPFVYQILKTALDEEDVKVACSCPDMKYRHAYYATQGDYNWGDPETRKPTAKNPDGTGSVCKHVSAVLSRPSQLLKYAAGWVATELNKKFDELRKADVDDEDLEIELSDVLD